jgi:hypothetical protein
MPIWRVVQRNLEDTLAEAIMNEFINEGDKVTVNLEDQTLFIQTTKWYISGAWCCDERGDFSVLLMDADEDSETSKESLDFQATWDAFLSLDNPPK